MIGNGLVYDMQPWIDLRLEPDWHWIAIVSDWPWINKAIDWWWIVTALKCEMETDWHQIGTGLGRDWHRIVTGLAADWWPIGIGLATDYLSGWATIGTELALALHRIDLDFLGLTRNCQSKTGSRLALDWAWIGALALHWRVEIGLPNLRQSLSICQSGKNP